MGVTRIKDLRMFQFGCLVISSRGTLGCDLRYVVVSVAHHSLSKTRGVLSMPCAISDRGYGSKDV